jgi:flagellar hook assembly protein FlgD
MFITTVGVDSPGPLAGIALRAEPNPARASQALTFTLPARGPATIEIYNVAGRRVRTLGGDVLEAGTHRFAWDGRDQAGGRAGAGLYFVRLTSGAESASTKILRLE